MSTQLANPFGLKDGVLVAAEDVPLGLECGCTCPHCGARFIARRGNTGRRLHFMHYDAEDCGASYESAAHKMAKEILQQSKTIMLPYLDVESAKEIQVPGTFRAKRRVIERKCLKFDTAELEVWMDGRIPDVVLTKSGRRLLVEIVVTHGITADKLEWVRAQNYAMLRVDMAWTGPTTLRSDLRKCLSTGFSPHRHNIMYWVHHPRQHEEQEGINEEYLRSVADGTVARPQPAPSVASPSWTPPKRDSTLFD